MAQPILLEVPASDRAAELREQLERAPAEHAEALLDFVSLIQALHDSGTLDLLRGAVGSKDKVVDVAATAAGSEGAIRAIRNLMLMLNMLSAIDPEVLKVFTEAVPTAITQMVHQPEKPGLWRLIKDFLWNPDFRHGLAAINTMLEQFGHAWTNGKKP
jgi:uncharacterized protein YjgD (DUF1641 family)